MNPSESTRSPYRALRPSRSAFVPVRGLRYHVHEWGDPSAASAQRPVLVLLHGWMDVGASFQFVVDALSEQDQGMERFIVAPDWRGFGKTETPPTDCYWFQDYYADLDALLDHYSPDHPVDLLGHSMGGNVVMGYAGARPERIRRLINLEGFGMPKTVGAMAPGRLAQWLAELKQPQSFNDYPDLTAVAARLRKNNPLLTPDKADWLAPHWARPTAQGRWEIQGDPAHKRVNPVLYRVDEHLALWQRITAPLLWVQGDQTDTDTWWKGRYTLQEFQERLAHVPQVEQHTLGPSGHMIHHDQPQALAALLMDFLGR